MERIYVAVTGDSCSIYYRPQHQFIGICNKKEAVKKIKELLSMTTEEFYRYLVFKVPYIRLKGDKGKHDNKVDSEAEKWYTGAWKTGTDKLLKANRLKMIDEDVPLDLIDELLEEKRKMQNHSFFSDNVNEDDTTWTETENLKPRKLVRARDKRQEETKKDKRRILKRKH